MYDYLEDLEEQALLEELDFNQQLNKLARLNGLADLTDFIGQNRKKGYHAIKV